MADEARVFAEGVDQCIVRQFTVADGTAIAKGSVLVYDSASRTAKKHALIYERPCGITTSSKEANDGITELGCQRTGVAIMTAAENITTGDVVMISATANKVCPLVSFTSGGLVGMSYQLLNSVIGRAIDTIAAGSRGRIALTLG